jgi:MFS family permease
MTAERTPGRLSPYFRSLRHRNFRLFWFGQMVSLIGTWMQSAAQWWLVHSLTHEPIWLGIVGTATFLPVFLFTFLGGVVADRVSKRRLIVATQTASMLLAIGLSIMTFTGAVRVGWIIAFAFALGSVNAFDMPARQAFIIEMVGGGDLLNAIALNSSIFNAARVLGPALAGIVIAATGEASCFMLNGISYAPVIVGLLAMRLPPRIPRAPRPVWHELAEGFRYVRATPAVRAILQAVGIASTFGMSYTIMLPIFADKILGKGPRGYGFLMGAVGIGAVVSAIRIAGRESTRGSGRVAATGMGIFGAALIAFSFSRNFILSEALLLIVGAGMITQLATSNTYLQTTVPNDLRGRVLSIYSFVLVGLAPIGSFLTGAIAQKIGAPWAVGIGGAITIIGAAVFAAQIPRLRAARSRATSP